MATSARGRRCVLGYKARDHSRGTSPRLTAEDLHGHKGGVGTVAFSPDGRRFATGSWDRTIRIWDANNNVCTHVFNGHSGRIRSLAFSPSGTTLASASFDGH